MNESKQQRRLIIASFVISPAVINFILNGLIAWLIYSTRDAIPLWGAEGFALDILLTFFLIAFLTSLIITPLVHKMVEQGDLAAIIMSGSGAKWRSWLPSGKWRRAALVGLAAVLGGLLVVGLLALLQVTLLDSRGAMLIKASAAAILAAVVTPLLAVASLRDMGREQLAQLGRLRPAIPVARLAKNGGGSHISAMQKDMIAYVEHLGTQGRLLRIPLLGPVYAYFVNDPELVREVLVKKANAFHKPANVKNAAKGLQIENVFTADGDLWQALRQTMQPAFHARRIEKYAGIMVADTQRMLAGWEDGERIDIPQAMMALTLSTTTRALFGRDMSDDEAGAAIVRFIELFYGRISSLPVPGWLPTRSSREMKQQIALIEAWLSPMIAERKASTESFDDVLAMLIAAQKEDTSGLLTDHQVRTEVMNLFAAGYEVVANTLAFTLYLVSQHPEVEVQLREELDVVLHGQPVSLHTLGQLTTVEMVLKESMRLLPVTTVLTRQTAEAVELDGYRLPKNRLVLFSPWALQRNAAHFPDPLLFQPERFDPQNGQDIPRYAYLPFSAGPRVCLGNTFAMMQMTINLATIWQEVHLTLAADHHFEAVYSFNARPKNGLPMVVRRDGD